ALELAGQVFDAQVAEAFANEQVDEFVDQLVTANRCPVPARTDRGALQGGAQRLCHTLDGTRNRPPVLSRVLRGKAAKERRCQQPVSCRPRKPRMWSSWRASSRARNSPPAPPQRNATRSSPETCCDC